MNDLISRQAAIDAIEHANGAVYWNQTLMENLVSVVKSVPTIDPVKRGKWIPRIATGNIALIECSECQFHYPELLGVFSFYYCPHCGAKMERDRE